MTFLQAIIISIIEGITEFLPISSTAHMKFANPFLGIEDSPFVNMFEVVIQLAAILSVVVTHIFAIRMIGFKAYLQKWFSLQMFGVFLFVGILELVSEFTKIISLSFRLFGNIFAGEVVLGTVSSIFAFFVPLPFYFLELIVAFVQAAVFMMLTLVFMVLLSEKHEAH